MKKIPVLVCILAVLGAGYYYRGPVFDYFSGIPGIKKPATDFLNNVESVAKEIIAPPPLRVEKESATAVSLSRENVFKWTNFQRAENGLAPLSVNTQLNFAALEKVEDMFNGQYFAHVSPEGHGVDYWVTDAGYEYLVVGENLALGNFESEKELVGAWMDSPGHRANILNNRFKEIGIATLEGKFEGRTTWLAVQVFGKPASDCVKPDENLAQTIDTYQKNLSTYETSLALLKSKVEDKNLRRGADKNSYVYLVEEYNSLVSQYNASVEETKIMVEKYNDEVRVFNNCIAGE